MKVFIVVGHQLLLHMVLFKKDKDINIINQLSASTIIDLNRIRFIKKNKR